MSKHIRSPLALAIALSLFAALPAMAQDAPKEDTEAKSGKTTTMEQITVTARRREETLQEVPVAVTAFTETALENLNVQDMGDLDAQVPFMRRAVRTRRSPRISAVSVSRIRSGAWIRVWACTSTTSTSRVRKVRCLM